MNDNLSGWNDWTEAFDNWTDISISELHGIISGLMTVCNSADEDVWSQVLEELSLTKPSDSAMSLIVDEAEDVVFQLKDKDDAYGYAPLVPDDEHELYERVIALKNWAGGYITGMGMSNCSLSESESDTLADLAKIASIRINPEDEFEGGEESYLHLFEFARLIPVSLATKKRKPLQSIPLIAGIAINAKTANEIAQAEELLAPTVNSKNKPS